MLMPKDSEDAQIAMASAVLGDTAVIVRNDRQFDVLRLVPASQVRAMYE